MGHFGTPVQTGAAGRRARGEGRANGEGRSSVEPAWQKPRCPQPCGRVTAVPSLVYKITDTRAVSPTELCDRPDLDEPSAGLRRCLRMRTARFTGLAPRSGYRPAL